MPEVPPLPGARSLVDRVDHAFSGDGPLAATFDGFEARPGQRQLAAAVAAVVDTGGTLVAEAGTGTGKTLAYLVPAALAGTRVLLSTGTRTLQDQVYYKDIPALARALGREVRAAYMKGRTNYLCRHRFSRLQEASAALAHSEQRWIERIAEWSGQTETGDRGEIDDMPDDLPLWSELTATSEQCLGRDCPEYSSCFITKMRDAAAAADIVVVNHHLLCADASVRHGEFGEVIPACNTAIIDEAHQLEDVVTQYFGVALTAGRIENFVRDATQVVAAIPANAGSWAVAIAQALSEVQHAARRVFDAARHALIGDGGGDRVRLSPDMAARLHDVARQFDESLAKVIDALTARTGSEEDVKAIRLRAEGIREDLGVLVAADDARYVHFIEVRGRHVSLRAAPIETSAIIRDVVLGGRHATVLTSATLTVEASFDYVVGRLGLTGASTLRLPSEFDYRSQAILYLPSDMPEPKSREFNPTAARHIAALLERSNGRAFVLFTSYAAMRDVHERLVGVVPWTLFVQGTAPRSSLLRDFRATPNAVLLATASFWQGVDVAGDALSCVIIDRLPFASPADPLVAARIAAIQERGGHPFHEYQVPLATLTLLQGLGRLIRTHSDRGVLSVLDPRLTRMSYGRRFLASIPPARITDDLDDIARFFARANQAAEAGSSSIGGHGPV